MPVCVSPCPCPCAHCYCCGAAASRVAAAATHHCLQVIISPHVYPPTITKATFLGTALWEQCAAAFGYLQTRGYCHAGRCTTFPVLIGETGSFMKDAKDVQWLSDFAEFVQARVRARTGDRVPCMHATRTHASLTHALCCLQHRVARARTTGSLPLAGCGGRTTR